MRHWRSIDWSQIAKCSNFMGATKESPYRTGSILRQNLGAYDLKCSSISRRFFLNARKNMARKRTSSQAQRSAGEQLWENDFQATASPTPFRSPDHFLMSTEVNQVHKPTSPIIFDSLHMPEIASTSTPHALVSVIDFPRMMEHGHTCMGTGVAKYVSLSDINILSLIEPIQRQSESSVAPS